MQDFLGDGSKGSGCVSGDGFEEGPNQVHDVHTEMAATTAEAGWGES